MATEVIMPKVDMDQETGTISEWVKHNGDKVKEGETILVIETAKVAIDVEAPASGILDGITSQPGDVIPIATIIAYILQPGEESPKLVDEVQTKQISEEIKQSSPEKQVLTTPVARNMANAMGIELTNLKGTGVKGKITKNDIKKILPETDLNLPTGKVYATPAARRIAEERGINLNQVVGSGPKQRIQANDVSSYASTSTTTFISPIENVKQEDEVIPLIGMRNTIAQRLTMSYQTIPHIKFTARIDMTEFNRTRTTLNTFAEKSGKEHITATAMFVKITATALTKHPYLNASMKNDSIILHKNVNIGVAVALDEGLIVPVVQNAVQKSVAQIAAETSS
jgi:pyruvate dehydrogenase E2 component (dihydrolipoamide acetyltransferase)